MIFAPRYLAIGADRLALQGAYLLDETLCVNQLLSEFDSNKYKSGEIQQHAMRLVQVVRDKTRSTGGLNAFLQQYDLSSQEGVVLLCLAEALLRIPDAETADRLIRDKLTRASWEQHLGQSESWLVNAGTWGLMLTGRIITLDRAAQSDPLALVNSMVSRVSEPVIRAALKEAMRIMGHQFVMGRTIEEALERSENNENRVYRYSFDMLGEAALSRQDAEHYFEVYLRAIEYIRNRRAGNQSIISSPGISVKLSALHPRFEYAQRERVLLELTPRVKQLAEAARLANITMTIDGEEADRLDITLDMVEAILQDPQFASWRGLGVVVQAYQKRASRLVDWLSWAVNHYQRKIMVRLVKGAYWDTEIKRAQEQGLSGYPVFTRKQHTDVSYLVCAQKLLSLGDRIYSQFATHNAHTAAAVRQMAGNRSNYELQRLHGMGEVLYQALMDSSDPPVCRVYAPVGSHRDLLPYLVRRLLENGANTSFINRISDARLPIEDIVADPVQWVIASGRSPHPRIPLPEAIYGATRKNSQGINLADEPALLSLRQAMTAFKQSAWTAASVVNGEMIEGEQCNVVNPANHNIIIGRQTNVVAAQIERALSIAKEASAGWNKAPFEQRAALLERAADSLQDQLASFASLIVTEGGRCIPDAIAEVREAGDFCRYYASVARSQFMQPHELSGPTGESNVLSMHGRGVFVCISPWNFPLAIFTGQVVAALVTGNSVIAKPARQTSLVAAHMIQLLHNIGIPKDVLHLLVGSGAVVGDVLLRDQRVGGVAFTGSTETATRININLAQRGGAIAPLIAETGGQNAMIVDSSALPEQVVNDVMKSAFNSAGQRCSALRVLFLQNEIAPRVIELLAGAMQEIRLGDPACLATDVGPVIDKAAQRKLQQHVAAMMRQGSLIYQVPVPGELAAGTFVGPCAFEIQSLSMLKQEIFGPVLHIIRYAANQLDDVIAAINATSYGLTLGIHSRIEEKADYIAQRVRVGNIYVNRNIIGASVGVQPFGGEGLSGTGPKAGGPHYLYRFCTERVVTTNCAAIGGNASLLSLK
ncbi:MAG: bifunctional proline dehydrogenase/L-glutamate gamma-semialdehyde dehydrogenase PutA [Gammaproteobacteria bacterium]|nr:bifunctional proline dehydrogenase/L-glutamate gamma-semialdehyde dehydrogenase PutA [Gammaproteobacteria bacterium]